MLTLDELGGKWLLPEREADFSLPAITNFHGMVQAAWGVSGIQNWTCAPTSLPTPTALLYVREGDRIRRFPRDVQYRWKAYEIERRGHGVSSVVRMPEGRAGVMQRLRFDRDGRFFLVIGGLPRVWHFTDYWNLPAEDVPMLNVRGLEGGFLLDDTKTFGVARFTVPGRLAVYDDLQSWLDGAAPVERGRIGVAEFNVRSGDEITWHAEQTCEATLQPLVDFETAWASGRTHWERIWQAAFTPGNSEFGGHLPTLEGEFERLYDIAILSLLMTRRHIPRPTERASIATGGQCVWSSGARPLERAYVWGGPEGAPTTSFLWELEFQAPLLARLDPVVLRQQLEAMMAVDLHRHWGIETITGAGAGMGYGVNPGAFLSCVRDYVRITGDREWALRHIDYLRGCLRPELTDYGDSQNILECVSTYEHVVAAFNALAVMGLRFMADLTGEPTFRIQADSLAKQVLTLFADGPFVCVQPDGTRRTVRTILDFHYVGRSMTEDLSEPVRRKMLAFFRAELQTDDWLYALSPQDPDALTRRLPTFQTFRADHQATGSYDGWPARAASVLFRFGERDAAIQWLRRIQELTHEGPFGQAHFIHPDGARKAGFFNGNCYFEAAGCGFATTLLEDDAP